MALVTPRILQVVGYQNSGKTTFIEKLLNELRRLGLQTVTIKHHGHGGQPEGVKGKDSSKHLEAGAVASIVEGAGKIILEAEQENWSLERQVQLASILQPDVILIEGHKTAQYPKLVLLRDNRDAPLLGLTHVVAALYSAEEISILKEGFPSFNRGDARALEFTVHFLTDERI